MVTGIESLVKGGLWQMDVRQACSSQILPQTQPTNIDLLTPELL